MGGVLHGIDVAGDGSALRQDDHVVDDDVGGDSAGEFVAGLRGGAVEGLGDADGNGGSGRQGDVMDDGRRRWWWRQLSLNGRWWLWRGLRSGSIADDGCRLGLVDRLRSCCGGLDRFSGRGRGYGRDSWGRGGGDLGRCNGAGLHDKVVDDGLDSGDLASVAAGGGARCVAGDVAAERDDTIGDSGLDGLAAEILIGEEAGLHLHVDAGVVGFSRGGLALAADEDDCNGEGDEGGARSRSDWFERS